MIKVRKIKGLCQRVEKKIRVCAESSVNFILISGIYTSTSSLQSRKGGCCSSDFTGMILVGIQGAPCPSVSSCFYSLRFCFKKQDTIFFFFLPTLPTQDTPNRGTLSRPVLRIFMKNLAHFNSNDDKIVYNTFLGNSKFYFSTGSLDYGTLVKVKFP